MILTSDAATILRELEVVHPAAKLVVMASQQQEAEMGDATNLVIVLAGELLKKAEELIRMGLKTSDIVLGYEKAQNAAQQTLEGMSEPDSCARPKLTILQSSYATRSKTSGRKKSSAKRSAPL
jgi:chaperonin GroEL (HSP60 family)